MAFGEDDILKTCEQRSKGIIYVQENSYDWHGPWKNRSGWQQVADANTGLSYSFGQAMRHDEPITPIFPHSDYCTDFLVPAQSSSPCCAAPRKAVRTASTSPSITTARGSSVQSARIPPKSSTKCGLSTRGPFTANGTITASLRPKR
ncbi:hypothetical protein J3F83DRAFT_742494 [Trichoderma novae-zelandiae]